MPNFFEKKINKNKKIKIQKKFITLSFNQSITKKQNWKVYFFFFFFPEIYLLPLSGGALPRDARGAGTSWPDSFKILTSWCASRALSGVKNEIAVPFFPARPVLPILWT